MASVLLILSQRLKTANNIGYYMKITKTKIYYSWNDYKKDVKQIVKLKFPKTKIIYGIPKGGLPLAVTLSNILSIPLALTYEEAIEKVNGDMSKLLICDDVSDSGNTLLKLKDANKAITITLFKKDNTKFVPDIFLRTCKQSCWILFPWEVI